MNPPTPTALKILAGNPGHRPLNPDEPKPQLGAEMPEYLSPEAKKHWPVVYRQLHAARVVSNMDETALSLYCETFARWRSATDALKTYGLITKTPNGFPVQSPFVGIANKAQEQLLALLREFGMTPSARTKVSTVQAAPQKSRLSLALTGGGSDK